MFWLAAAACAVFVFFAFMVVSFATKTVPAIYPGPRDLRIIAWALFGNDEGGIYGERDLNWVAAGNTSQTLWTALRWWKRNPFHNLTWHVLSWKRDRSFVLYQNPPHKSTLSSGMFYRDPTNWVVDGPQFQATLLPMFVSWRTERYEGYAGWRENGVLGFAARRV